MGDTQRATYRGFRFESFWTRLPGYGDVLAAKWNRQTGVHNSFLNLHIKMQRTGKALKQWATTKLGNNRLLMVAARKLIAVMECVQERRQLSEEEIELKQGLKQRLLGFAAIEKLRARQRSRLTWIKGCQHKAFFPEC